MSPFSNQPNNIQSLVSLVETIPAYVQPSPEPPTMSTSSKLHFLRYSGPHISVSSTAQNPIFWLFKEDVLLGLHLPVWDKEVLLGKKLVWLWGSFCIFSFPRGLLQYCTAYCSLPENSCHIIFCLIFTCYWQETKSRVSYFVMAWSGRVFFFLFLYCLIKIENISFLSWH